MKKYTYVVQISAGELVGFFEYLTIHTEEEMDINDLSSFEDLQEVMDVGDDLAMEEEASRLNDIDSEMEDYEEEYQAAMEVGTSWGVTSVREGE